MNEGNSSAMRLGSNKKIISSSRISHCSLTPKSIFYVLLDRPWNQYRSYYGSNNENITLIKLCSGTGNVHSRTSGEYNFYSDPGDFRNLLTRENTRKRKIPSIGSSLQKVVKIQKNSNCKNTSEAASIVLSEFECPITIVPWELMLYGKDLQKVYT